jgi:phosphatidylglycerophosphate synthase
MQNAQKRLKTAARAKFNVLAVRINMLTNGNLKPDMVTYISVLAHAPIGYLIVQEQLLIAGILLIFFGSLDALDGALARIQKSASGRGMLLDATTDRVKETILYGALSAYFVGVELHWAAVLCVIACGLSLTVSYVKAKGEAALAVSKKSIDHHTLNRAFEDGLGSFETRIGLLIIGLLFGLPAGAVIVITLISAGTVFTRYRKISRII